ncbi:ankyrin repeat domain-containing protein [Flavobacterium sp. Sd200]|uniref:ankyrin repeat domain-containing protein n=1 Tax=Flavobacterium sp. Sd200 TaxID=2692211 RepID=UPI00136A1B0D|nr:ankyrin repeat domain-containing protein [Flavobacterium sp. Sd200]MXN90678.1 ankyrin repeat domain-containing protein [Flavobacterium sp. Sd200]
MKKSIIYSAFALVAFCNITMASTSEVKASEKQYTTVFEVKMKATPLAQAIAKGDVEAVKKFIEYGADVNEKSNDMTPLMIAARYNQVEIINLLIKNGADIKATNEKGFNALKYAEMSKANDAVTAIKKALDA